mgnify:CR=1 FL=1
MNLARSLRRSLISSFIFTSVYFKLELKYLANCHKLEGAEQAEHRMSFSFMLKWGTASLITYLIYRYSSSRPVQRNFPPGPKPLPVVGNARDFPGADIPEFQHWLKHKDLYGPISSVTVLGMTLVVIHDKKVAHDLLEQNSIKTSGRPTMVFANQMCGYETIMVCQGYNSTFRHHRKLLHQELGTKVSAAQFRDVQEIEVNRQLVRVLNDPEKCLEHFKT